MQDYAKEKRQEYLKELQGKEDKVRKLSKGESIILMCAIGVLGSLSLAGLFVENI